MQAGLDANLLNTLRETLEEPTQYDDSPIGPSRTTPTGHAGPGRQANRASWGKTPDAVHGQERSAQVAEEAT